MSVEVVGCVALFVEGEVFFILQEPETVSKMGYIGKYFAKLFKGWVALMSTSSIFLVFIPLLLQISSMVKRPFQHGAFGWEPHFVFSSQILWHGGERSEGPKLRNPNCTKSVTPHPA
jgi:hypothetical protein